MMNCLTIVPELPSGRTPRYVKSPMFGVVSPSPIDIPLPLTFIAGAIVPVPWIVKLKGFSSVSLLAMFMVAVFKPDDDGLNSTVKEELPPAAI